MRVQIEVEAELIKAEAPCVVRIVLAEGTKLLVQMGDDTNPEHWKPVAPAVLTKHLYVNEKRDPPANPLVQIPRSGGDSHGIFRS